MTISGYLSSQDKEFNQSRAESKVVLMQPLGDSIAGVPRMELIHDTSSLYQSMMSLVDESFVGEFLDLYNILQAYLNISKVIDQFEPAYLAITSNEGGFARQGFSLSINGEDLIKNEVYYIDISKSQALRDPASLMSFTQLYPHEMGHVFLHLLCKEDTMANNTNSVNMHFFNTITDFSTAFNEGFAEHLENVSRAYEKNENIRSGILHDVSKIERESTHFIEGFRNDFLIPSRLGYYKTSMIYWYQRYEDFIRYQWAMDSQVIYKNERLDIPNIKDIITFRNSGVSHHPEIQKNLVQKHATEGVVSSFFTHLSASNLGEKFLNREFYRPFLSELADSLSAPEQLFTPLENLFVKYFYVLHNHVVFNQSERSQLSDFVNGYISSFPEEAGTMREIYERTLQISFDVPLPPSLWLMSTDYLHRMVVFDPFDAITIPIYTFDLNAAEIEDLMTIKGVGYNEANKIMEHREKNGLFESLNELEDVDGLSDNTISLILASKLEQERFEQIVNDNYPTLTLQAFLLSPLKSLLVRSFIYFLLIYTIIYLLAIKPFRNSITSFIAGFIKYYLLWVVLIFAGLISIIFPEISVVVFVSFSLILLLIGWLVYRKRPEPKFRLVLALLLMSLSILPSIW